MLYYRDGHFPDENEMNRIKSEKALTFMSYLAVCVKKMVSVGNKRSKKNYNAVYIVYVDENDVKRALYMCAENEALKVLRTMRNTNDKHIMFSGFLWEKRGKEKLPYFYLHKIQDELSEEDVPYYREKDIAVMKDKCLSNFMKQSDYESAKVKALAESLDILERCQAAHPNYKVTTHRARMKLIAFSETEHPLVENELRCDLLDRYCRSIVSDISFKCIFSPLHNIERYKQERISVEYKKIARPDGTVYRNVIMEVSPIRVSYRRIYEYDTVFMRINDSKAVNAKSHFNDLGTLKLVGKRDIKMEVYAVESGRDVFGLTCADVVCKMKGNKYVQRLSVAGFTRDEMAYVMRSGGIVYLPNCEVYYNSEDGRTVLSPDVIQSYAPDATEGQEETDAIKYDKRVEEMMKIKKAFAKVKGNEEAKNSLSALISRWVVNGEKCNIFLGGSTGSGKDYLISCLQDLYPDAFAFANCAGISESGYNGKNFSEVIRGSMYNLDRNQRCILALNEFDALCRPSIDGSGRDMHHAVQKEVLCMLDGTESGTEDTLFIMMGSNQIERELIEEANSRSIGFGAEDEEVSATPLTPHEYSVEGGMITELAARIDHFITTVPLTVSEIHELCEEKIDEVVNKYYDEGVELELTSQFCEQFKRRAVELAETEGARAIKNVFNIMFSPAVDYEISLKKAKGESIVIDIDGVQSRKVTSKGGV